MTKTVAVIPGEDAAAEAVDATLLLLEQLDLDINWVYPPVGQLGLDTHSSLFPDEAKQIIDVADAALFGATSGPSAQALFYLRWGKQTYANIRPTRFTKGFHSPLANPENIDFVIVREKRMNWALLITP